MSVAIVHNNKLKKDLHMTTNDQEQGGIHARHIRADNVVSGVQVQGGDPNQATALISLAQGIRRGDIRADEIVARNLVSGLQYITDPEKASPENLRREVAALRANVEHVITVQEIPDLTDAEDAKDSLTAAEAELAKPSPNGQRVLRKLDEANTILTKSAQAAEAAGKLGALVIKLAPVAATIWQAAHHLFGI